MGKKTLEKIFPETRIVGAKMLGKKSSENVRKNRFLYLDEYRDLKMGGKNARNNFSRNTNIACKKCWE